MNSQRSSNGMYIMIIMVIIFIIEIISITILYLDLVWPIYIESFFWNFNSSNYILLQLWVLQTTQQRCFARASAIDTRVALSIATPRTRAQAFCLLILAPDFRTGCSADRRTKMFSRAITSICGFAELSSIEAFLPSFSVQMTQVYFKEHNYLGVGTRFPLPQTVVSGGWWMSFLHEK